MEINTSGFDIDAPRWDQGTFLGRVKHFFNITDPRTILVPEHELDWAKAMVERSRMGTVPPGTHMEQLLYAKKLYDSAFHPDTGEKMNVIGRMSFQVPGGMLITGFMLHFYRTMPAVIFWQWVNQSFNALVNYTNRNAASPMSVRELIQGISVQDKNHNEVGHSQRAAAIGIAQVVISRITMAAPGMILLPVIMERLEKLHFMKPPLHGTSGMWALSTDVCLASFLSGTRSSRRCRGQGRKTCTLCLFQQGSLNASCQQGPACEYLLLCTPVPTFLLAHKA
nr:sideroflexin-2 isoform X3 [Cavia porcellus]